MSDFIIPDDDILEDELISDSFSLLEGEDDEDEDLDEIETDYDPEEWN